MPLKDLWKDVTSAVFEDDKKPGDEKPVAVERVSTPAPVLAPVQAYVPPPTGPNPKIEERLFSALRTEKVPAYAKLAEFVEMFADTIPDESMRYKAAIKATLKSGVSLDQLLADFDSSFALLDEQEKIFQRDLGTQTSKNVAARRKSAADTTEMVTAKRAEMKALEARIAELEKSAADDLGNAAEEERKITEIRASFTASHASVKSKLEGQKNKVAANGKGL
jgi:hypothetical protein